MDKSQESSTNSVAHSFLSTNPNNVTERLGLGQGKQLPLLLEQQNQQQSASKSVNAHILSFGNPSVLTECERAGAIRRETVVLAPLSDGSGKRGLARIIDA